MKQLPVPIGLSNRKNKLNVIIAEKVRCTLTFAGICRCTRLLVRLAQNALPTDLWSRVGVSLRYLAIADIAKS